MRLTMIASAFMALASAFLLYGLNMTTRLSEARVRTTERQVEAVRGDIAVLRAERANLANPARIEVFARAQGLRPLTERQFVKTGATVTPIADAAAFEPLPHD